MVKDEASFGSAVDKFQKHGEMNVKRAMRICRGATRNIRVESGTVGDVEE